MPEFTINIGEHCIKNDIMRYSISRRSLCKLVPNVSLANCKEWNAFESSKTSPLACLVLLYRQRVGVSLGNTSG